jgi:hypothetical protein
MAFLQSSVLLERSPGVLVGSLGHRFVVGCENEIQNTGAFKQDASPNKHDGIAMGQVMALVAAAFEAAKSGIGLADCR